MEEIKARMQKSLERFSAQLGSIRTGRANPELLSRLVIDYYGSKVPLQQLASISVPESMMLLLTVFDQGAVQEIERAISSSSLGLTPQTEGTIIRLRVPELTEERRIEMVKLVKHESEEGRVSIRHIRRDSLDELKSQEKNKEISEDEYKSKADEIQKVTDDFISKIDGLSKNKESDLLTI